MFSFGFYTINLGWSIVYTCIYGCQFLILKEGTIVYLSKYNFYFKNSKGSGAMRHNAAFHLGLHCLQDDPFRRFQYTMDVL